LIAAGCRLPPKERSAAAQLYRQRFDLQNSLLVRLIDWLPLVFFVHDLQSTTWFWSHANGWRKFTIDSS
jgi:hypothetical protein